MNVYQWRELRIKVTGLFVVLVMGLSISACGSSSNSEDSQTADTTVPQLSAHANVTVEATSAAGATVNYDACMATDDVDSSPVISYSKVAGSTFPLGTTTITCTATDSASNTANASFDVTVVDTTAPSVTPPANIVVSADTPSGSTVSYSACTATDDVDSSPVVSYSKVSSSTFPLGATTVTCTATDAASNTASASFGVTVVDTTAPQLAAHANVTVEATSAAGATVNYSACIATDNTDSSPVVSYSKVAGSAFTLGATTVTCTATDAAGNAATTSFNVTVVDTTAPLLTAHADVTVEATSASGATVNYDACTATDNADSSPVVSYSKVAGSTFTLGTTTVTCTATDAASNAATTSFDVTVVDTTAPVVTLHADVAVEADASSGATVTYSACAVSDAADASPVVTYSHASGTTYPLGTTTVTCTATDAASNAASTSFDVTVADTTAPAVTPPTDVTVAADAPSGSTVNYSVCTATDAVDASPVVTYSHASGATFPVGTTTVTCTATDATSNAGTATFDITVNPYTELDITFGSPNGYVIHDAAAGSSANERGYGLVIDGSGNIVVVGESSDGSTGVLWRYTSAGVLDTTFSGDGVVIIYDGGASLYEHPRDLMFDGSGNLVVAGYVQVGFNTFPAAWRYDNTGALDTSYDTDGMAYFDMTATNYSSPEVTNATLDNNGKVVMVGYGYNTITATTEMLVWRFNTNGSLDTSLCTTGFCVFTSAKATGEARGQDVIIDANDKIVITGGISPSDVTPVDWYTDIAVLRLNDDGTLDTSFDTDGIAMYGLNNKYDEGKALKFDANNKIVVTGHTRNPYDNVVVVRFNTDGSLDAGFGTSGGTQLVDSGRDRTSDLVITAAGHIRVLGTDGDSTTNKARHTIWQFNADGSLDTTFDSDGLFVLEVAGDIATGSLDVNTAWGGITLDAGGKTVVTGASYNTTNDDMTIWRLK